MFVYEITSLESPTLSVNVDTYFAASQLKSEDSRHQALKAPTTSSLLGLRRNGGLSMLSCYVNDMSGCNKPP
jgi:hypothetical protein